MADKALPIIFLNLSGEMIYVIQQRLEAQNISKDKSSKVIWDIVNTMLNDQFIEELFKPQNMYSRSAMQSVFEKLVHSSIMRLNTTSMSKLYDLMLMVFKYQVLNCKYPEDILLVTLNHMDAIKACTAPYPELKKKFENVYSLLISNYKDMPHHSYQSLYNCITVFLHDMNIRVSVLMRLGLQLPNGEIVIPESVNNPEKSSIIIANCIDSDILEEETIQENWRKDLPQDCFELEGNRSTSLGTNIYTKSFPVSASEEKLSEIDKKSKECNGNEKFQALEEITLLSRLIGNSSQSEFVPEILLNPKDEDFEERNVVQKRDCCYITIDASQKNRSELGKISNEFIVEEEKKEKSDILELLDFAETKNV